MCFLVFEWLGLVIFPWLGVGEPSRRHICLCPESHTPLGKMVFLQGRDRTGAGKANPCGLEHLGQVDPLLTPFSSGIF